MHRIPGGRGQGVFARVHELDHWMDGVSPTPDAPIALSNPEPVLAALVDSSIERSLRPPGILVLPFETRGEPLAHGVGDTLCQHLITRLSAIQPVRVLSWITSRSVRTALDPLDALAARLHVRYLVEGVIECAAGATCIEAHVVDADLDQVMLAERFVVPTRDIGTAQSKVAEGVALHFALIHAGALVEPLCLSEVTPSGFLDYLDAARFFFEEPDGTSGRSMSALDRALQSDPDFVPARSLRGLALLKAVDGKDDGQVAAEARSIASACSADTSSRVTTAFLNAAIAHLGGASSAEVDSALPRALRWVPPAIASEGRLYERRSPRRARTDHRTAGEAREASSPRGVEPRAEGQRLFDEWLRTIVAGQRRQGGLRSALTSMPGGPAAMRDCEPFRDAKDGVPLVSRSRLI